MAPYIIGAESVVGISIMVVHPTTPTVPLQEGEPFRILEQSRPLPWSVSFVSYSFHCAILRLVCGARRSQIPMFPRIFLSPCMISRTRQPNGARPGFMRYIHASS